MTKLKNVTFNEFCENYCDKMYEPNLPQEAQSTGYLQLKKMVVENIKPASLTEIKRWEKKPTQEELASIPDIKYLRFLHPLLRGYIIKHWKDIKKMKID